MDATCLETVHAFDGVRLLEETTVDRCQTPRSCERDHQGPSLPAATRLFDECGKQTCELSVRCKAAGAIAPAILPGAVGPEN